MSASSSKHITSEYGYHGDDLQVHLHIMNNENHQEPMDGLLATAINGPILHFLWATPPATKSGGALDTVL